jgi:NAD(P)-dependent dehydrogenase (short-subunit alcohol dehydrogenase family)
VERTIVVTGASSGIGRASAMRLVREGFLVFAGVRNPLDAERLRHENGDRVFPIELDVTDGAAIAVAVETVRARVGGLGLHGLVNNAGIGLVGPLEYMELDELRRQFEVNVFGQIAVTQAFLPLVRAAHGRIVNMTSVGSHIAIPFGGALCASKSAFGLLSDALRLELHASGIAVSIIEPGAIATPAVDKTLGDAEAAVRALPPEGAAQYGEMIREFMRRGAERERHGSSPDVVAAAVAHALTARRPKSRYVVGKDARLLTAIPRLFGDGLLDRIRYRLFGMPA